MTSPEATGDDPRNGVQSVEIGMSVLSAVARAGRKVSLTEIARELDFTPSKVHRYFTSFVRSGMLVQHAQSGLYEFGPLALKIGLSAMGQIDAVRFASEKLDALREATGMSVLLVVWGDMGPTVVRLEENIDAVRTNIRIGSVLPVLTTAIGRVFLAYLPEAMTARMVERETQESETAAAVDRQTLIAEIRATRCCQIESYVLPNVIAMAAPVLDSKGEAAAVVALLTRPLASLPARGKPLATLDMFCRELSVRIGGS